MAHRTEVAQGRDILARWCSLAERRLEYLTELYETGRWRRYHSEPAFLENFQEAKAAVETWRDLVLREASRDNRALDVSWLGRAKSILPPAVYSSTRAPRLMPTELPAKPPLVGEATAVPDLPLAEPIAALAPDLDVMQNRYPLLRNAL